MRITKEFYLENAIKLAPKLIGKLLCRKIDDRVIKLRITQTECYYGTKDTACHAHKGRTPRTDIMYSEGGYAYVYLCYGIHFLLNIVTGEKEHPEAVLIRGVEGYEGPGKLTKALHIDKSLNKENLGTSKELWLEDDGYKGSYTTAKRIGIEYATPEYKEILWRFIESEK